jgi:hypothetical protein
MDTARRAQMQARIVLVVYRSELARLALLDMSPADRLGWEDGLRQRSVDLLDQALDRLGRGSSHAHARRSLIDARAEIARPIT